MKRRTIRTLLIAGLLTGSQLAIHAQDRNPGMPGDQFNLYGALEAFKKSNSPEAFERMLNQDGNSINNLDLNDDGEIDYIRVINKRDNDVQLFILQIPVTQRENQDIAVIELERTGYEEAVIQIVGDKDIFGEEVIIEPTDAEERNYFDDNDRERRGPSAYNTNNNGIFVNVWGWPGVRFVFAPGYVPWVSTWSNYRPPYWYAPRRTVAWSSWHPQRNYYSRYYAPCTRHRIAYAPRYYQPYRNTSVIVYNRYRPAITHYPTYRKPAPVYRNPGHSNPRGHAYGHGRRVIVRGRR
ncbi:hypothetical protein [Pollutibacter soli]|uniref:hypothetical protein n=1 Tax=Pollutibacter soli TaxID=3034157 RepID=UPI0030139B8E